MSGDEEEEEEERERKLTSEFWAIFARREHMSFSIRPQVSAKSRKSSQLLRAATTSFHGQWKISWRNSSVCCKRFDFDAFSVMPRKLAQQWSNDTLETVMGMTPLL